MKPNIFIEIGIGNDSFITTEIEYDNGTEIRQKGWIRFDRFNHQYMRLWIKKTVYILSTKNGFETLHKSRNNFKFIFGIAGYKNIQQDNA